MRRRWAAEWSRLQMYGRVNFTIGFRHCCQAAYAAPGKNLKAAMQSVKAMYEKYDKAPSKKWSAWYNEVYLPNNVAVWVLAEGCSHGLR